MKISHSYYSSLYKFCNVKITFLIKYGYSIIQRVLKVIYINYTCVRVHVNKISRIIIKNQIKSN